MRATDHLTWVEMKEFGGLWTAGESTLMPSNAAQIMSGCHPQPGGGLRGFLKPSTSVTGTGMRSTYLNISGAAGESASTPDSESDLTENTIQVDVALADWTPAAVNVLASDLNAAGFLGMELRVTTGGNLELVYGNGAGALVTMTSTAAITTDAGAPANNARIWVKVEWFGNSGGSRRANFYASRTGDPEDWTTVGVEVTGASGNLGASANAWTVGMRPDGTLRATGKFYHVFCGLTPSTSAWNVVGDFENQTAADTTWTSRTGETWTVNGNAAITNEAAIDVMPIGFEVVTRADGATDSSYLLYLVTQDYPASPGASTNWQAFYRHYNGAESDTEERWRAFWGRYRGVDFNGQSPRPAIPSFTTRKLTTSTLSVDYVSLAPRNSSGGTSEGGGVFQLTFEGETISLERVTDGAFDPNFGLVGLTEHQSRLVAGYQDTVVFTSVGGVDWDSADGGGFVAVNPAGWFVDVGYAQDVVNEGAMVAWIVSVPPGDLLVATNDGTIYNVQGDMADPTVRRLGQWAPQASQIPASTPSGVFFVMPNSGVYRITPDGSVQNISPGLDPTTWGSFEPAVGLGSLAGTERYLFAPNQHVTSGSTNGPLVYDFLTNAWFCATHASQTAIHNPRLMATEHNPTDAGVWVVPNNEIQDPASVVAYKYRTGNADISTGVVDESRNSIWEYKSAPFRSPDLDNLDIRKVMIPAYAWNATSTIAVTVDGVTVTKTLPSGRSVQEFTFRARGKNLDIDILSKSNDTGIEAPMIEAYRVGFKPGPGI